MSDLQEQILNKIEELRKELQNNIIELFDTLDAQNCKNNNDITDK